MGRKSICHLSLFIVHCSFVIAQKSPNEHWALKRIASGDDKWQMNNDKGQME
jgi:hypothetical protein